MKERIEKALRAKGMTQTMLAQKLGLNPSTISLNISRDVMPIQRIKRIAEILDVPLAYLIDEDEDYDKEPTQFCPYCGAEFRISIELKTPDNEN